jgi:hypothetical protein
MHDLIELLLALPDGARLEMERVEGEQSLFLLTLRLEKHRLSTAFALPRMIQARPDLCGEEVNLHAKELTTALAEWPDGVPA